MLIPRKKFVGLVLIENFVEIISCKVRQVMEGKRKEDGLGYCWFGFDRELS